MAVASTALITAEDFRPRSGEPEWVPAAQVLLVIFTSGAALLTVALALHQFGRRA